MTIFNQSGQKVGTQINSGGFTDRERRVVEDLAIAIRDRIDAKDYESARILINGILELVRSKK